MQEFLDRIYYGNSIQDYLIAIGIAVVGIIIIRIFRKSVLQRLKRWSEGTETNLDDYLVSAVDRFGLPVLNFAALYFGISYLELNEFGDKAMHAATVVVICFYALRLITILIRVSIESYVKRQENGEEKVKQLKGILLVVNLCVWFLGIVFLFDNLGYDVTTIIAGLGIGGIAIALAAQNILGDLFNYFVIFFDRPFEIGDFIVVDDKKGNVEYIGIKSTRLKSLSGEQIVISNTDLTNSRLHNFKRMEQRRILFNLGVTYQTTPQQLRIIPDLIKTTIEAQEGVTFDRAHFASYGDSSLNFEVVYFVMSGDYNVFMDINQQINLSIFEVFAEKGIEFAYPTQTLFLNKESK